MKRREFLKKTALATGTLAFPVIIPASALGKNGYTPPSDRITMAIIGAGSQGKNNMNGFLKNKDIQITAICDVDEIHLKQCQNELWKHYNNNDCKAYNDFRELLEKEKIDTASIATPDHWHMLLYTEFAERKIDIYGEKPLVRYIEEGKKVVKTVTDNNIIWQTGSWQRSRPNFRKACELVANGVIGKIMRIEVGLPDMNKTIGMPEILEPPKEVDYEFWLGPAPYCPYRGILHWDWRWIMNYSGGQLTDWCGHHVDIALWSMGLDNSGPVEISGEATFTENSLYNVPYTFDISMKFHNGLQMRVANKSKLPQKQGICWYGEYGWIFVNRMNLTASNENFLKEKIPESGIKYYKSDDHLQNFLDSVKSRKQTIAPVGPANRAITAGLLGEIAFLTGEKINWNPVNEELINPSENAMALLKREYRKPWLF
jgi:predicted dehydrogenase